MTMPRTLLAALTVFAVTATISSQTKVGNPITGEGLPNPAPKVTRNWGQLPAGTTSATAGFTTGGLRPAVRRIPAVVIEGIYWVAEAAGGFAGVTVHAGPVLVSGRLRRVRAR